ncbi:facilitated trehalose transporter Tret1-2 homolog [Venturia canescens]|uniref:facilitated trehalose transporter Tret1-2 homolog n=1 Tax=Venturia canescens TaxID=32260 RepID=UPI001C9C9C13|nr:facilitated trehalose transporter Tret1-2 homolog [Venturia canescens]
MTSEQDEQKMTIETVERTVREDSKYYGRQIQSALVPILSTVVTGMTMGYSAILLPQLKVVSFNDTETREKESYVTNSIVTGDSGIIIHSIDEESWIAASAALTMAPGCWFASLLMDKLGRKTSILVISPVVLFGWLTIALGQNFVYLVAGRLLCGLSAGLFGATSPVYIAETTHPRLRGLLITALSFAVTVGILFVHALGTWLDWRLTAFITSVIPIACMGLGVFIPESPNWLLSRGKREDALAAWTLLRGDHSVSQFDELKAIHEPSAREVECDYVEKRSKVGFTLDSKSSMCWTNRFSLRAFFVPLLIVCVMSFTSQFSGINVVTFYCVQMIQEVSGPKHGYVGTLILDVVRVLFSVFACWLTRRYSRRILAMISGFGTCIMLFFLSVCIFNDFGRPWLPIVLLFVYAGTVAVGLGPLPWLLCAELFDDNNRGLGSGLSAGFAFLCFFAVVKTGPQAFNVLTPAGTFALYGMVALLGSLFLYRYLPETKDKTLRDIEKSFTDETSPEDDKSTVTTDL